jgi:hypothetical protein
MNLPRSEKSWLIAGISAAFAAVILCACGLFAYQFVFKASAEDTASAFLDAVQDKDAAELRELVCESLLGEADEIVDEDDDEVLSYIIRSSVEDGD